MSDPTAPMPRRPSEPGTVEQRAAARAALARRLAVTLAALAILGLLAASTYTAVVIRHTQQASTPTLKAAAAAAKAAKVSAASIADCTTPGRPCYERGKKQTASAVGNINRVVILAAACSAGLDSRLSVPERQDIISSCVINRLSATSASPSS